MPLISIDIRSIRVWQTWPTALLYFPVLVYMFFYGLFKQGHPFLFALANPELPLGGLAGESKEQILKDIDANFKPKSMLVTNEESWAELELRFNQLAIQFPIVLKPDTAEGGFLVQKAETIDQWKSYHYGHSIDYLIQEFVELKHELSLLFYRSKGQLVISSLVRKVPLSVLPDGKSTIRQLLKKQKVSSSVIKNLKDQGLILDQILEKGQESTLSFIANVEYGAEIIDESNLIDLKLEQQVVSVLKNKRNMYYGRIDLKANSLEDVKQAKFKILEINGVKGEPLHIYSKSYKLSRAYKDIFQHWKVILNIANSNIKQGYKVPSVTEVLEYSAKHLRVRKQAHIKRNNA